MPRFDGTGPAGKGPMTGRGLGYCILKNPPKKDDSNIRGYVGIKGVPVASLSRKHLVSKKPGIDPKLTGPGLVILKQRAQILTRELSRLRGRISKLEKEQ